MEYFHIRSANFPNVHVRLDGNEITRPLENGGGLVNCQYGAGPWETFSRVDNSDGTLSFESLPFPNVFLRMYGMGVTQRVDQGAGVVNGQYTAGPYEKFHLVANQDRTFSLRSAAFNNVFLRIDGRGVTVPTGSGAGTVNCQFNAYSFEKLVVCMALTHSAVNAALDRFVQAFPGQAAQINANRNRIVSACCPPFDGGPPEGLIKPQSSTAVGLARRQEALTPCQSAVKDVVLDTLGIMLSAIGLYMTSRVRNAIYDAIPGGQLNAIQRVMEQLCLRWAAGGVERVHAFYDVINTLWSASDLLSIIWNAFYEEMSWWDWIVRGATGAAIVTSWFATDSAAFFAEFVLLLLSAVDLFTDLNRMAAVCA